MTSVERLPPETLCVVCEDLATGNHYSVPSCNGCKTFFRRAIVNQRNFVCESQGNCPINKGVRCACRACRLAKCLAVGMDPNSIQGARDSIGYTKRSRRNNQTMPNLDETGSSSRTTVTSGDEDSVFDLPWEDEENQLQSANTRSSDTCDQEQPTKSTFVLLERLTRLENTITILLKQDSGIVCYSSLDEALKAPSRFSMPIDFKITDCNNFPSSSKSSTSELPEELKKSEKYLRARIVALYIEWAKTFSAFQKLPHSDKIALIKSHASSYMIISEAFRNCSNDSMLISSSASKQEREVVASFFPFSKRHKITEDCSSTQITATISDPKHLSKSDVSQAPPHSIIPQHISEDVGSSSSVRHDKFSDKKRSITTESLTLSGLETVWTIVDDFIAKPFFNLNVSLTEVAALQAIMFFDPDAEGLDAASQRNITAEQKKFIAALHDYISEHYPSDDVNERFTALIMRTSVIKKAAIKNRDSLEMLDICNVFLTNILKEAVMYVTTSAATATTRNY